jgi:prepilin-type N-terminal cleavage/methylation domain-containing protein
MRCYHQKCRKYRACRTVVAWSAGFTIIELIVVLVALGIFYWYVSTYTNQIGINISAQADMTANDIRYAQMLSMTQKSRYRFVKVSSSSYSIQDSTGTAITLPSGGTTVVFGTGITFGTWVNLPSSLVIFDSSGIPYTDVSGTALASTATIPLTNDTVTKNISIAPQTGLVTW